MGFVVVERRMGRGCERFGLSGKLALIWRWPNDDRGRMSASCRRKPASRGRGVAALDCGIAPPAAVKARGTSAKGRDETALRLHSGEQAKWHIVYRRHVESGAARLAAQEWCRRRF